MSKIFTITGPSGVGKTSVVDLVSKKLDTVDIFTSHTTRQMREGEKEGRDYYYISEAEFIYFQNLGIFFESTEYAGNRYGCSKDELWRIWESRGNNALLVAEPQGVTQIKKAYREDHIAIFMATEDIDTLVNRMKDRGDDELNIAKRMATVPYFMSSFDTETYNALVINSNIDKTVDEVIDVIKKYS